MLLWTQWRFYNKISHCVFKRYTLFTIRFMPQYAITCYIAVYYAGLQLAKPMHSFAEITGGFISAKSRLQKLPLLCKIRRQKSCMLSRAQQRTCTRQKSRWRRVEKVQSVKQGRHNCATLNWNFENLRRLLPWLRWISARPVALYYSCWGVEIIGQPNRAFQFSSGPVQYSEVKEPSD